jgi:hypothetical protein
MNKSLTTEEVVIVSCLAVGWAITTITRELLVPLVALLLTLLGWRPNPPAGRQSCGAPVFAGRLQRPAPGALLPVVVDSYRSCAQFPPLRATMPPHIAITYQPKPVLSRAVLHPLTLPQLRRMAELRNLDPAGLRKPELIEAILDHIDDAASNGDTEALTPEQRSPSPRGRRR